MPEFILYTHIVCVPPHEGQGPRCSHCWTWHILHPMISLRRCSFCHYHICWWKKLRTSGGCLFTHVCTAIRNFFLLIPGFFRSQTTQKQVRNFLRDRSSRMILWGFSYNFESLGSSKFNAMSPFSHPRGYPNCTLNHRYPLAESGYQKSRTFTFWAPTLNPHVA